MPATDPAEQTCPNCSCVIEAITNLTGKCGPEVGEFTVCIYCGEVLRFTAKLTLEGVKMHQVPEKLWPEFDTLRMHIFARNTFGAVRP